MKKFIIERKMPGAGDMTEQQLEAISKVSNAVITILGKPSRWVRSFVTGDKLYCIHEADNKDEIREHAICAELPIDAIEEIKIIIGPSTAG